MKRDKLKDILQSNYNRGEWRNVLTFLSGNKNLLKPRLEPKEIVLTTQKATNIVKHLFELGTLETTDGITLPIFEIELQDNIKIEYNKVGVNQLIKEYILKDAGKGAIATYHYADEDKTEWRFSFISKFGGSEFFDEVEDVETNPKKYTYIFGTPEEHRTALERLYNLEQSRFRLEDFFEAFNVEPVSNNFFKEYKNFYLDFVSHLSSNDQCREVFEAENTEDVEKDIRNFVKRLLGRIVFLYFLQKKHWLGATDVEFDKEGKPIKYEGGDTNFLFNLFEADKEQFYTNWLSKLFFKALNTPDRKNDGFDLPEQYFINRNLKESDFLKPNNNQLAIPFLNGGLFEEHQEPKAHKTLKFPGFLFEELFTFFNGYNFTIYENSPEDHTVAVDPEMLGNIFENLLEDNNDKGTFYTPKEIVHYMTQESLIEYLNTHLNSLSKVQIENLIKNQVMDGVSNEDLKFIEGLIDKVKICDPAIGSGAFPMGLLQEIFSLKAFIHFALDRPQSDWYPADIKQNIIQNSIYGVDLEEDAVDIARLRFWLSLVVDEEKPKPLPNLDYKIMQGNSLLESFEGIPLNNTNLFNAPTDRNISLFEEPEEDYGIGDDIKKLMDDYFNPKNYRKKQAIHKAIDKKVIDYIDKCLEGFENQKLIELAGAKQSLKRKTELKQKTQPILKEIEQIQDTLNSKGNARKKLVEFEEKSARPYFLWHLFFKDVFEDGGFDIVIGNPPYVQLQKMGDEATKLQNENYKTFRRTGDIYTLFYEKGNTVLKNKGILSYITSNTWMRTKFGEGLREYFAEETNIISLLNFEDTQIFPSATVEVNILLSKKEKWDNILRATAIKGDYKKGTDISDYEKNNHITLTELPKDGWVILDLGSAKIKQRIENIGKPLKDWDIQFYRGFLTGFNDAFFIDEKKRNEIIAKEPKAEEIIKPLLRGREIKKYGYDFTNNYVIFSHNGYTSKNEKISNINIDEYPIIKEHLDHYWEQIQKRTDKGITPYNLRNCAYVEEFNKEKIVWLAISDKPAFALDNYKMHVTAPAYIMTSDCNRYLLALLNSKTMEWYLDKVSSSTGQGTNQWSKLFVEQLPIPQIKDERSELITKLVNIINYTKDKLTSPISETVRNVHIAHFFEEVIDGCVFELYFKEHMLEKGINIIALVQQEIVKIFGNKDFNELEEQTKNQKILEFYKSLKNSEVQQRMRLFVAKSPDILKPILQS
ncbi:MAG: hypothetical protein CMO82_13995 [Winogradskyella sp.]|nr:hypothetical protein [Winogradskyella sp.]|tara:strand:+ start:14265 stop:17897 length:3633 start_codon:yes stop_codon:yes gene_type:complete